MKSIFQESKVCFLCGAGEPIHVHHIFNGLAYREKSEKDGMMVYLCPSCHQLVHDDNENLLRFKRKGQMVWEGLYGDRKAFIKRYGKNYLC